MNVLVNGETMEMPDASSVARLIEQLGLRPEQVAVELNRELVPRTRLAQVLLADGDELELVTLVGGG